MIIIYLILRIKTSPHDLNKMGYIRDTNIHTKSSNIVIYNKWYKMYNLLINLLIIFNMDHIL